jgi:hypothetical protein
MLKKRFNQIALRYEKPARRFLALVRLAAGFTLVESVHMAELKADARRFRA